MGNTRNNKYINHLRNPGGLEAEILIIVEGFMFGDYYTVGINLFFYYV